MHIDPYVALAGLIVGFTVGLTGMGGGALMTPILVLLFKVNVSTAVASDLVAALVMKPVGAGVHIRKGTVNWNLVRWLCIGSVPMAFAGVFVVKALGKGSAAESDLKIILGVTLIVAALSIVVKSYLQSRAARRETASVARGEMATVPRPFELKKVPTLLIGALGGLVVGMTSVGSGSLIIVLLLLSYPMLSSRRLVGTDLVQAIPLVGAAALGHILFGDFQLGLTGSILIGSIPGVFIGARVSSRAPDAVIRPALVFVLLASGLKLLNVSTSALGWTMLIVALVAIPLIGAYDAAGRPEERWIELGQSKRRWIGWQTAGAPFGVGFLAAIAYFTTTRPKLAAAAEPVVEPAVTVPGG